MKGPLRKKCSVLDGSRALQELESDLAPVNDAFGNVEGEPAHSLAWNQFTQTKHWSQSLQAEEGISLRIRKRVMSLSFSVHHVIIIV